MREIDVMDRIHKLSTGDVRLFRNNVGMAYTLTGAPVRFGLHKGSPDLIGWKRTVITPDMVGKTVAVAIGIEVKTERGRPTPEQTHFLDHMKNFGALAGIARNVEEAKQICVL